MEDIRPNGIEKLLTSPNPHKASCHDQIKPIILKALSKELPPIIAVLFHKSLDKITAIPLEVSKYCSHLQNKGEQSHPAHITH